MRRSRVGTFSPRSVHTSGTWRLVSLELFNMQYATGRFNQPACTDCDRIGDYIKDEGAGVSCI